jgi:hypothetical protein
VNWIISEGRGRAERSRGLKPLLRKRILLDFSCFRAINTLSTRRILRFLKYLEFKELLALKRILRLYAFLSTR